MIVFSFNADETAWGSNMLIRTLTKLPSVKQSVDIFTKFDTDFLVENDNRQTFEGDTHIFVTWLTSWEFPWKHKQTHLKLINILSHDSTLSKVLHTYSEVCKSKHNKLLGQFDSHKVKRKHTHNISMTYCQGKMHQNDRSKVIH